MRLMLVSLILGPVLALAAAGLATGQEGGVSRMVQMHQDNQPSQIEQPHDPYAEAMLALKTRMLRQIRADGGKLTPEHQAAIQKELDAVNQRFHRKQDSR